jgi:hypothetical protein
MDRSVSQTARYLGRLGLNALVMSDADIALPAPSCKSKRPSANGLTAPSHTLRAASGAQPPLADSTKAARYALD